MIVGEGGRMVKELYEWVVIMSKGDEYYLTENQYEYYKDNIDQGHVFFDRIEINPFHVVSAYKRKAQEIQKMYPCPTCGGNVYDYKLGRDENGEWQTCKKCKGARISL